MRLLGVARNDVALPEIASVAQSLEILNPGVAALAPGDDVIDVENDAMLNRRAAATRSATKRITSKYAPSHPQVGRP